MKVTITIPDTELCNDATWFRVCKILNDTMNALCFTTPEDCTPTMELDDDNVWVKFVEKA